VLAVLAVLGLLACTDDAKPAASTATAEDRVEVVMANKKVPSFADLCDVAPAKDAPKPFSWPAVSGSAAASSTRYRWVNVWATWCKPCVEEMPLLSRVFGEWHKQGQDVTLSLLSVDADAAAMQKFMAEHPGTPSSLQISDASQTTAWLTSLGLATGSAIPVHMVVDAAGNLVCARSGGISQEDLERFRQAMFVAR
jgi:thiol-disulfide isomerase/thioredoxin